MFIKLIGTSGRASLFCYKQRGDLGTGLILHTKQDYSKLLMLQSYASRQKFWAVRPSVPHCSHSSRRTTASQLEGAPLSPSCCSKLPYCLPEFKLGRLGLPRNFLNREQGPSDTRQSDPPPDSPVRTSVQDSPGGNSRRAGPTGNFDLLAPVGSPGRAAVQHCQTLSVTTDPSRPILVAESTGGSRCFPASSPAEPCDSGRTPARQPTGSPRVQGRPGPAPGLLPGARRVAAAWQSRPSTPESSRRPLQRRKADSIQVRAFEVGRRPAAAAHFQAGLVRPGSPESESPERCAPRPARLRPGGLRRLRARDGRHARGHRPAVRHQVRPGDVRARDHVGGASRGERHDDAQQSAKCG